MKKYLLSIIVVFSVLQVFSQLSNFSKPKYTINDFSPRSFYWDMDSNDFYIGGNIYLVNSKTANRTFRTNLNGDVDYMDTVNPQCDPPLIILKYNDTIYHAGFGGLYTFNDTWYSILGNHAFKGLYDYKGDLLIGGLFQNAVSNNDGVVISYKHGKFKSFNNVESILDKNKASVSSFAEYKDKLYMAGNFQEGNFNEILSWDGSSWESLDSGIYGNPGSKSVVDMVVYKNELYVGGIFSVAGGSLSNNILKWDGNQWYTIGNGIYGGGISDLYVFKDELWVIGSLDSVDNLKLHNIAIWNGIKWCRPEGIVDDYPLTLGEFMDTLYIGGSFNHIEFDSSYQYISKINPNLTKECGPSVGTKESHYRSLSEKIKLFPNPASTFINIEIERNIEIISFQIYNVNGRIEKFDEMKCSLNKVNISSLRNGIYMIKVNTDKGILNKPFIVE